jgi:hypothetical protein
MSGQYTLLLYNLEILLILICNVVHAETNVCIRSQSSSERSDSNRSGRKQMNAPIRSVLAPPLTMIVDLFPGGRTHGKGLLGKKEGEDRASEENRNRCLCQWRWWRWWRC